MSYRLKSSSVITIGRLINESTLGPKPGPKPWPYQERHNSQTWWKTGLKSTFRALTTTSAKRIGTSVPQQKMHRFARKELRMSLILVFRIEIERSARKLVKERVEGRRAGLQRESTNPAGRAQYLIGRAAQSPQ
jgi:hypothetical protein